MILNKELTFNSFKCDSQFFGAHTAPLLFKTREAYCLVISCKTMIT